MYGFVTALFCDRAGLPLATALLHPTTPAPGRVPQFSVPKRPIADILTGAFASRFDGLLSRNPADFESNFPSLNLVST